MCLALPAQIVERIAGGDGDQAVVNLGGVRKTVSLALVPEAQVGDYVVIHVGYAIGMLDTDEAERTLALFAELDASRASESAHALQAEPHIGPHTAPHPELHTEPCTEPHAEPKRP